MVKNIIILIAISLFLSGCSIPARTEYKNVNMPVLVCPVPPEVTRPKLTIENIKPEDNQDPGNVAQQYKATVKQLQGYITELETIIKQYDKTSKEYDELRKKVDELYPFGEKNETNKRIK